MQFGPVNQQQDVWGQFGADLTAGGKDPCQGPNDKELTEHMEQRRSKVDSNTAHFPEGYHRELSNLLGELATPRSFFLTFALIRFEINSTDLNTF